MFLYMCDAVKCCLAYQIKMRNFVQRTYPHFLHIVTVVTLMNAAFIDPSVMHFSTVLEGLRAPKYHLIAEKILYLNLVLKKSVALLF